MKVHEYREMYRYLTRKPLSEREVELAYTDHMQKINASSPMPVASGEGLVTEPDFYEDKKPNMNDPGMVVDPSKILPKNFTDDMPFVTDENNPEQLELAEGGFATGFEHGNFVPLTKKQREIAKKIYGLKESEVDSWQTDKANKRKKASIVSGEITLETKYANKNYDPNRIIVQSPRATEKVTNVIFPNKQTEKSFKKDVKEKFSVPQGKSEKSLEYFSKNYPLSERQAFKAVNYVKNQMGLEYPKGSVKADIEKNKTKLLQLTSQPYVESYIRSKIKQPILEKQNLTRKIDLAHRISKEHMKYLGLQFDTRTTGFDSRLINQVIIRPSEIVLDKLYKKQRNLMDTIKKNGLTDELSKQLEDINNKVRTEAKKTNGRLIGVTIDSETLDPYFEGKKAKLGLTNKILDIKEIGEMPIDKRVKFLTNQIVPRIQAEIDRGFTPNDYKEIISDPEKQKSIIKHAEQNAPDTVKELKEIFKNPTSTKSLKLYTDQTGIGQFLETEVGQRLSKSAPNFLKGITKVSTMTGAPVNALIGIVANSEDFKEQGLSDLETLAAGAYKGGTQDFLNFADLIVRKLPVATYEKFVEDKPFFKNILNKPEYFEFADKQIDKYTESKSLQDRLQNKAEYEVRKSFPVNISDTDVPVTVSAEENKNLIEIKKAEILNQNPEFKQAYEQELATPKVETEKKDSFSNLIFGPIVFPKYTQEELNLAYGGRAKLANGTDESYNPEIPSLGEQDPIGILEQQMINEKNIDKILALDWQLTKMKEKKFEQETKAAEYKKSEKEKGIRYKEDFPSEAAYFAETGKQLLTNPKYFLGKGLKGAVETTEWLAGQPLKILFNQEGKNFEFYHPVAGEKLGINKYIEKNIPKNPTTGTLLAGETVEIAGSVMDPFLAYGIVKGAAKASKTKAPVVIEETVDPTKRDLLKMGAVITGGAITYPIAKKLGLLETGVKVAKTGNAVRIATHGVVDNMPEFFPYLSEFSLARGKEIGQDYMRSGMTEFKREITIPLELNTIGGGKTNVKFEFIHDPAEGNVTAYYTNPLTDQKHMFDFNSGKQGRQAYGIDPQHPSAYEYHAVEVEPPVFDYKSPDKADPYRKNYESYNTATEGDDVIEALDKWYKGLSKEEKAKFENKFKTHSEYTDEIPAASYDETENYPIMDFMYSKKKND